MKEQLSLEDFNKLSEEERIQQFKNLSDKDKTFVRMTMPPAVKVIGHVDRTEEEMEESRQILLRLMRESGVNTDDIE